MRKRPSSLLIIPLCLDVSLLSLIGLFLGRLISIGLPPLLSALIALFYSAVGFALGAELLWYVVRSWKWTQ